MEFLASVRDFFGLMTANNVDEKTETDDDDGPLIAHRRPDGTIIRYEASESLLKAAASAAGSVPPPDLR